MKEKTMEKYAKAREKKLAPRKNLDQAMAPATMPQHDPSYDMDTLMRAEEIKGDGSRRRAAVTHGRKRMKAMAKALGVKKQKKIDISKNA